MGDFDPYHKWLGIRQKDQPPNHYRLLGVDLFEDDPDVIDAAAEQRMTLLRQCATGPHIEHSQRLLNEVAAAQLCLLKPADRAKYDAALKAKLAAAESVVTLEEATTKKTAPASDSSVDASSPFDFEPDDSRASDPPIVKKRTTRKPVSLPFPVIVAVALLVLIGVGIAIYSMTGAPKRQRKAEPFAADPNSKRLPLKKRVNAKVKKGDSPKARSDPQPQDNSRSMGIVPIGVDGKPLNLGFEAGNLNGWKATGDAFTRQPVSADRISRDWSGQSSNKNGNYFIGGFEVLGDRGTGTLTSLPFKVIHPYGSFLIGGGGTNATRVEVILLADGGKPSTVVAKAVGRRREQMDRVAIDLRAHHGQSIIVRLVDESSQGWGHLNFDDFRFHDEPPVPIVGQSDHRPVPAPPPDIPPNPDPTPTKETNVVQEPVPQKRAPVPNDEAYAKKSREIRETLRTEFDGKTPESKLALATKLLKKADEGSTDPDTRYGLCKVAANLAQDAGNGEVWLQSIDELAKTHDIDKLSLQLEVIKAVSKSAVGKLAEKRKAVSKTLDLLDEVLDSTQPIGADAFEILKKMAILARETLGQVKDQTLSKRIESMDVELDTLRLILAEVEDSRKILATAPDDTDANLVVGKYECFRRGDWKAGLARLRRASDQRLRALAEMELSNPGQTIERMKIGDGWWEIAADQPERSKQIVRRHAVVWYELSLAAGLGGMSKDFTKKRIREVTPHTGMSKKDQQEARVGNSRDWIDLLDWAVQSGDWSPGKLERPPGADGITLAAMRPNKIPIPAIIAGNYELEAEFTRLTGTGDIGVLFPVGTHNVTWFETGVAWISGLDFSDERNPVHRNPVPAQHGSRHRVRIHVEWDGEEVRLRIDFDETRDYMTWTGHHADLMNMENGTFWKVDTLRQPGFVALESEVTVHMLRARALSPDVKIRRAFLTTQDRKLDRSQGYVRLIGEASIGKTEVGSNKPMVNRIPLHPMQGSTERFWPLITQNFIFCQDYWSAPAPSRIRGTIPPGARSFTAIGYNHASRQTQYAIRIDGKQVYESKVTDFVPVKVAIPPRAQEIELIVDTAGNNWLDRSFWCYPRFHRIAIEKVTGKMVIGKPPSDTLPFDPDPTRSNVGKDKLVHNEPMKGQFVPIDFGDVVPCDEFLFAHAPSNVAFSVPEGMRRFTAIGYCIHSGTVRYEVWADGAKIYASPETGIVRIDVLLPPGTKSIELRVSDLGDVGWDTSIWCYPRLHNK